MVSVSEIVRRIIDADPLLRNCLSRGLANYNEVARRIRRIVEEKLEREVSHDTVKTAVIRYASKLTREEKKGVFDKLMHVLAHSSLELRTGVTVATVRMPALPRLIKAIAELVGRARLLFLMQSIGTVTLTISSEHFELLEKSLGEEAFIEVYRDQAVIVIVSPSDVISTPGFMSHITSLLAQNGINIYQVESVHTDTILVLSPRDAIRAFQLLREAIEVAKAAIGEDRAERLTGKTSTYAYKPSRE